MYKICLIALLALPVALCAEGPEVVSSSVISATDGAGATALQSGTSSGGFFSRGLFATRRTDTPVGTFTASYVYRYAPDFEGADRSQMGWSATPEVNFTRYVGVQAEFTGLYTRSIADSTNQLLIAGGPRFTFAARRKLTPFVFAEGGEVRTIHHLGSLPDWNPVAIGGVGLDYKISRGVAFQLIPGEYVGQNLDNGDWNHSFESKAGITFNLFR